MKSFIISAMRMARDSLTDDIEHVSVEVDWTTRVRVRAYFRKENKGGPIGRVR